MAELGRANPARRGQLMEDHLRGCSATQIATPASEIDASKPLDAYGIDSVRVVGLRRVLRNELSVDLAIKDLAAADRPSLAGREGAGGAGAEAGRAAAPEAEAAGWPGRRAELAIGILRKLDREAIDGLPGADSPSGRSTSSSTLFARRPE